MADFDVYMEIINYGVSADQLADYLRMFNRKRLFQEILKSGGLFSV